MSEVILNAELRESPGKRSKQIRSEGKVPGVFYGHGDENVNIQVSSASLGPLVFTSKASVIDLRISNGTSKKCIVRDVQFDPVSDHPIHFDLQGLREDEELTLDIPVVLIGGTPKGVREGGMLQHLLHKVKVSCLPKHIPEKIEINVTDLEIQMSVHVKDLTIPDVQILENLDSTIVAVLPPTLVKEPTPEETVAEGAAEPEVLGKGKKAEDEEGGEEEKKEE